MAKIKLIDYLESELGIYKKLCRQIALNGTEIQWDKCRAHLSCLRETLSLIKNNTFSDYKYITKLNPRGTKVSYGAPNLHISKDK